MNKNEIFNLIDGKVLVWNKNKLPSVSGVYIVFDEDENIYYVGKSANINKRWVNHHKIKYAARLGAYIGWIECGESEMSAFEESLILTLNPCFNGGGYTPNYISEVNISSDVHLKLISYCLDTDKTTKQAVDDFINSNIDKRHELNSDTISKSWNPAILLKRFCWAT